MNPSSFRRRWGERLVSTALGLAEDRRRLESGLAAESPGTRDVQGAFALLAPARWVEQILLWVGFRLHPGSIEIP